VRSTRNKRIILLCKKSRIQFHLFFRDISRKFNKKE
jgi:hypothetical protein